MKNTLSDTSPHVYILIPTYKEFSLLKKTLASLALQTYRNFSIVVINSNPGDRTSQFLRNHGLALDITEISATSDDYWTGAIAKGLAWIDGDLGQDDYIMFLNSDVQVPVNILSQYLGYTQKQQMAMFCAATVGNDRYISSGCQMKSWALSLTKHYLVDDIVSNSDYPDLIPVDMLAGRSMFFPAKVLRDIGVVNKNLFPHYGADYEFSCRAKKVAGYKLYVASQIVVRVEQGNTGIKTYQSGSNIVKRIRALVDIKSVTNLKYRLRFVMVCFPRYAVPIALFINLGKVLFETLLGRSAYNLLRRKYW